MKKYFFLIFSILYCSCSLQNQTGTLEITVSYYFNSTIGYKADVDAHLYVFLDENQSLQAPYFWDSYFGTASTHNMLYLEYQYEFTNLYDELDSLNLSALSSLYDKNYEYTNIFDPNNFYLKVEGNHTVYLSLTGGTSWGTGVYITQYEYTNVYDETGHYYLDMVSYDSSLINGTIKLSAVKVDKPVYDYVYPEYHGEANLNGLISLQLPAGKYFIILASSGREVYSVKNIEIEGDQTLSLTKNFYYFYDNEDGGEPWY